MNKDAIIVVSDWDISPYGDAQSGYSNIAANISIELAKKYNVIALGISYRRNQHYYPFSLTQVPASQLPSAIATIKNGIKDELKNIIVALDIPLNCQLAEVIKSIGNLNHVGIMAVEGDPVIMSIALDLFKIDERLIISQFGADECNKVGVPTKYLPISVDLNIWRKRTIDEKNILKEAMGLKDKTIFFINADGNERKNLSLHYEALGLAIKENPNLFLVVLTRKNSPVSWRLDDLAMQFGVQNNVMVLDREKSQGDVWKLYAMSDFIINCTKAEGLGMALLEGMAVGVPVIATNATAMKETLSDGRGILVDADFMPTDVFLNTKRYYIFPEKLKNVLLDVSKKLNENENIYDEMIDKARKYVDGRTIDNMMEVIYGSLK